MNSFSGKVVSFIPSAYVATLAEAIKVAITGGASGIGLATAKLLAARGAHVSLGDRNEDAVRAAWGSLGDNEKHMYTVIDVCESKSVNAWIGAIIQKFGRLDNAVNMAGIITPATPIAEETEDIWDRVLSINTKGTFLCLKAQIHAMTAGGSIVCAGSVFGQMGAAGNSAYCASKAAVISLSRTAAKENPHIRVNCVAPGSVNTPLSASENQEERKNGLQETIQKRTSEPTEVANVIAFLLSDEASFVTGAVYNVDGGWIC